MNVISEGIYNKLQAGTALTALLANGTKSIWRLQPPDNEDMNYVIYNFQGGGDENQTASRMINEVYLVRGYSKTSANTAGTIADEIDNLLNGGSITVTGYNNFWLNRGQEVEQIENLPSGEKAYMMGAFYRVRLDK